MTVQALRRSLPEDSEDQNLLDAKMTGQNEKQGATDEVVEHHHAHVLHAHAHATNTRTRIASQLVLRKALLVDKRALA